MKTLFSVMVFALVSLSAQAREAPQPSTQATQLNCQPPSSAPAANAPQDQFDQYSWQMFIALNYGYH